MRGEFVRPAERVPFRRAPRIVRQTLSVRMCRRGERSPRADGFTCADHLPSLSSSVQVGCALGALGVRWVCVGCAVGLLWFSVILAGSAAAGRGSALPRRAVDVAVPCWRAEAGRTGGCSAGSAAASMPAGVATSGRSGRRVGPFCGDDRVELGGDQVGVSADQVVELLVDRRRGAVTGEGCGGHDRSSGSPGQALMARRSSPLVATAILRGLACSATGICRVRTPAS